MVNDNRVLAAQASLTGRDLRLLGWLQDHGVLTTDQIAMALFPSLDAAQRRLLKLISLGVLARFRPQKWEGGTFPYHYVLDQLGVEVVAAQRGDELPRRDRARRRRHHLTSRANLPHLLGTNQFFIELAAYERQHPGARLLRWWPASVFHNAGGLLAAAGGNPLLVTARPPRPDGHGIWADGEGQVPFLLEYDLGTESHQVLLTKVEGYARVARLTDWRWPVLFWLPSVRRELNFHQALGANAHFGAVIATAAADHVAAAVGSPAGAVWWLHGHEGTRLRLAELPSSGPAPTDPMSDRKAERR